MTTTNVVQHLYLVRLREEQLYEGGHARRDARFERGFAGLAAAEAFCAERDWAAWQSDLVADLFGFLPPRTESLFDLTSFDPPVFLDWLEDAGIPRPEETAHLRDWERWWGTVWPRLTELQRRRLFEALDKFTFHEIAEVPWLADARAELPAEWRPQPRATNEEGPGDDYLDEVPF